MYYVILPVTSSISLLFMISEQSDGECSKTRKFWAKMLENWEENQLFSPKQVS